MANNKVVLYNKKQVVAYKKPTAPPLNKSEAKAVATIARKVVGKQIETKRAQYDTTSFVAQNGLNASGYFVNLIARLNNFTGLPQGTAEDRRIGDKVKCKKITLRMCFANHPYDSNTPYQLYSGKYSVRVILFTSKDITPTRATLFKNDSFPLVQAVDLDNNVVIYDKIHTMSTTLNTGSITDAPFWTHQPLQINVPGVKVGYKGQLQFQDGSSSTLKGRNIHMAMFGNMPNDGGSSVASVIWNGEMLYTDA